MRAEKRMESIMIRKEKLEAGPEELSREIQKLRMENETLRLEKDHLEKQIEMDYLRAKEAPSDDL